MQRRKNIFLPGSWEINFNADSASRPGFFLSGGYLSVMQKEDYDQALTEVSKLTQENVDLASEENSERGAKTALDEEEKKTHSIKFLFEGKENKEAEREKVDSEKNVVSKMDADIAERDNKIKELIQKKSNIDRMVPYERKICVAHGLRRNHLKRSQCQKLQGFRQRVLRLHRRNHGNYR